MKPLPHFEQSPLLRSVPEVYHAFLGVDPGRLTFSWVSASEGRKWADVVNETTERVRALGPFAAYRSLTEEQT